ADLKTVIAQDFDALEWSPDQTKILYVASQSATLPIIIKPPLIGANQTKEEREIKKGVRYVYDIKEDKNFLLDAALQNGKDQQQQPIAWLASSKHLLYVKDKKIHVVDYDGTNDKTIYAGPFLEKYVFPFP